MSTLTPKGIFSSQHQVSITLQPPTLAAHHLRRKCSIPCKRCCFGNSTKLERCISPRELILAESLLNRVKAAPPDAQLQASVVYMHFCFSVEQWIMLFYTQKVLDLFFIRLGTWQWLIDSKYFLCSLKSWQECSFFFPHKSQEHYVSFSFLSSSDCNIPHMSPELSHFYWSKGNNKCLAVGSFLACEFNLESSKNEGRQIPF